MFKKMEKETEIKDTGRNENAETGRNWERCGSWKRREGGGVYLINLV
jgi:hypothetical protein